MQAPRGHVVADYRSRHCVHPPVISSQSAGFGGRSEDPDVVTPCPRRGRHSSRSTLSCATIRTERTPSNLRQPGRPTSGRGRPAEPLPAGETQGTGRPAAKKASRATEAPPPRPLPGHRGRGYRRLCRVSRPRPTSSEITDPGRRSEQWPLHRPHRRAHPRHRRRKPRSPPRPRRQQPSRERPPGLAPSWLPRRSGDQPCFRTSPAARRPRPRQLLLRSPSRGGLSPAAEA